MKNYKVVPNQKVVRIEKEMITEKDLYAKIEMKALNKASKDLQAGAFKLWIYFAKNQENYEFALSSKAVEEEFGIKIKQYNNAIKELEEKGYLVNTEGNTYIFYESAVNTKGNNEKKEENAVITKEDNHVITKQDNVVITKGNKEVISKGNKKYNIYNNNITKDITKEAFSANAEKSSGNLPQAEVSLPKGKVNPPVPEVSKEKKEWLNKEGWKGMEYELAKYLGEDNAQMIIDRTA